MSFFAVCHLFSLILQFEYRGGAGLCILHFLFFNFNLQRDAFKVARPTSSDRAVERGEHIRDGHDSCPRAGHSSAAHCHPQPDADKNHDGNGLHPHPGCSKQVSNTWILLLSEICCVLYFGHFCQSTFYPYVKCMDDARKSEWQFA